jgi:TIR domain
MLYDIFIAHSGDDKDDFVRPLAEALIAANVEVWFDEFSLQPGDSLRRAIDHGLSQSRFGAVVLSPSFFQRNWPRWELNGLVQRHLSGENDVVLPIWYGVTKDDVLGYSPPLADIWAIDSRLCLNSVVARLLTKIHPKGSTLIHARDYLIHIGYAPPVISDDWWLDVAEHSAGNDAEGTFQEAMGWGRWGFPLPDKSEDPDDRGWRLAWAAAQMIWQP